jgi:hypothetical protein
MKAWIAIEKINRGDGMIEYAIYSWLATAAIVITYLWFCKPMDGP